MKCDYDHKCPQPIRYSWKLPEDRTYHVCLTHARAMLGLSTRDAVATIAQSMDRKYRGRK